MPATIILEKAARRRRMLPLAGARTARQTPPVRRAPALAAAVDTMMRGAAFLYGRAAALDPDGVSSDGHRATVVSNSLRELDRFFNILLDELAAASGISGQALRVFRRRRTATAKLAAYPGLFGHRIDDRIQLLALASQRATLLSGAIKSGTRRNARLIARPGRASPPRIDLQAVSAYYGRLAARIIRHVEQPRAARPSRRALPVPIPNLRPASVINR